MQLEIDDDAPVEDAKTLLREYPAHIPVPLEVEDFDAWVESLPGPYRAPGGRLLVARADGELAGCVLMRALGGGAAEVKRLYVREAFRGRGVARALVARLLADAREAGYTRLRLDTHLTMAPARALYESFGFRTIDAYWDHPVPDVVFYELTL